MNISGMTWQHRSNKHNNGKSIISGSSSGSIKIIWRKASWHQRK